MAKSLSSASEVIDALGGTGAVKRLLGHESHTAISNWRKRGALPADTFLIIGAELEKLGLSAPPSLWGIAEPAAAVASRGAAA